MAAIWFLLFDKCKAIMNARSLGVGIPEQEDAPVLQTVGKNDWKSEGLAMLKKQGRDTITGRIGVVATKLGRLSTVRLAIATMALLSMTAYVFYVRCFPARALPLIPLQGDEKPLAQVDDSEPLPLGSVFGCNSPAPPAISVPVGRSSAETDTPDLSTPAAAMYSVLSLIDQTATDKLAPCLAEETEDPVSNLYPQYLGHPVELVEVIEDGESAEVIWDATVHTAFSLKGKQRFPGETITLTARLVQVEGLWKLLQFHDGDDHGN